MIWECQDPSTSGSGDRQNREGTYLLVPLLSVAAEYVLSASMQILAIPPLSIHNPYNMRAHACAHTCSVQVLLCSYWIPGPFCRSNSTSPSNSLKRANQIVQRLQAFRACKLACGGCYEDVLVL